MRTISLHYIHSSSWRCPWCHGYRHRKWTQGHEFKSWTRLIAFHIALIPWERYESNYAPSSYGVCGGQTGCGCRGWLRWRGVGFQAVRIRALEEVVWVRGDVKDERSGGLVCVSVCVCMYVYVCIYVCVSHYITIYIYIYIWVVWVYM